MVTALDDDYPRALLTLEPRPPTLYVAGASAAFARACGGHRGDATRVGLRAVNRDRARGGARRGRCGRGLRTGARDRRRGSSGRGCGRSSHDRRAALRARSDLSTWSPRAGARHRPGRRGAGDRGPDRGNHRAARLRTPEPRHRRAGRGGRRRGGAGPIGRAAHRRRGDRHGARAVCRSGPDRRDGVQGHEPPDRRQAGRNWSPPARPCCARSASRRGGEPRPWKPCRRSKDRSSDTCSTAADRSRS